MMLSRAQYEEVLEMRREITVLRADLQRTIREYYARKYNPNQPRVPAGSREGGRWMDSGSVSISIDNGSPSRVRLADAGPAVNPTVMSDATPDPIIPGAQYASSIVERFDKTGNPKIDEMSQTLMDALAKAHASVGDGAGPVYGIVIHGAFGSYIKSQNLPGVTVEQSFNLGDVARYGLDGSIRTDVALRDLDGPNKKPIAIWDVKTGDARLSGPRVAEIRDQVGVGSEVPIIELHIRRGITRKAFSGAATLAIVSVCVWDDRLHTGGLN